MSEQETTYECASCSTTTTDRDNFIEIDEQLYCDECGNQCSRCDVRIGTDGNYIDDRHETWCDDCAGNYSSWCEGCDERYSDIVSFYDINDENYERCEYCANNNFNWCDDHESHFNDYCYECDTSPSTRIIHDYGYKPDPEFMGKDKHDLYFGIEVETEIWSGDIRGSSSLAQGETTFYLKHDSSVGYNTRHGGFEVVSHPHTIDMWQDSTNPMITYLERIRDEYQARSWDAESSCGLHIHISRAGFTSGAHTHRFLTLIYSNPVEMSKLGGRKSNQYAKFNDVYKFDEYGRPYRDLRDKLHASRTTDRHSAVNVHNRDTLELRWFQGTLKREGILANIQLAHAMVEYTRYLTVAQVREGALRWDRFAYWVTNSGAYPQLTDKIERIPSVSLSNKPKLNA